MRNFFGLIAVFAAVVLAPLSATAQQGTIMGQVVDGTTQQPIPEVQVFIEGTTRGTLTNAQGRFQLVGVPAGTITVRATRIGYNQAQQQVTVAAGESAVANFTLNQSAVELGAVVVTATGQQQRVREIGSAVGVVDVEQIDLAPVQSMTDLLQGRVAGMSVLQSSGTTGSGARVRIRGNNSISLSNAPLLVIDGVRVESSESFLGFGVGGQSPSRLNDLNPEEIESIEVLKGPAASALYGTAAANGVIQVTTKRGRAGAPSFRAWAEYGQINRATEFPDNVYAVGANGNLCPIFVQAQGSCTPAETYRNNPLENSASTPFETGDTRTVGGSLSGGSEAATFFVSAELQDEDGIYNDGANFGDRFDDMDDLRRVSLRANLTGNVGEKLTVGANVGYIESQLELPQADNALFGLIGMGLSGIPDPAAVEAQQGYASPPAAHYDWITGQDVARLTGSLNANFRPLSWLSFNGTAGIDRNNVDEMQRIPRESFYSAFGSVYEFGFIQLYATDVVNLNTNLSGSAVYDINPDLNATTTLGTQYLREDFVQVYSFGSTLLPGVETSLAGATADFEVGESNVLNATVSAYGQQQFAWRDQVFFNAAVRGDKNTAFGTDIGWIWYPSFSGSWVVSEAPFFPEIGAISSLRLRAAYGQAGLRPGATAAIQTFGGVTGVFENQALPGFTVSALGNPDLKPERSTEWEFGFESGLLDDRFGLEVTYFNKSSRDALVQQPLPPSLGGSSNRWVNLGEVSNSGVELLLNGAAVRTPTVQWNFGLSGSLIDNELVDLGLDAQGQPIPPILLGLGSSQQHREGYSLGSWFQRPIVSFNDADGDGLLAPSDVVVGDTAVFLGNPFPSREFAFNTDVTLWDWLRISTLFDYRGGHELLNATAAWRATADLNSEDIYNQNLPLDQQAAIIARRYSQSYAGFIEDASFMKWRELAFTFGLPRNIAERFGAEGASLTLAGRNLATWTDYTGFDPEINFAGQHNFNSGEFYSLPPNRTFTIRVDANF